MIREAVEGQEMHSPGENHNTVTPACSLEVHRELSDGSGDEQNPAITYFKFDFDS